VVGKLLLGAALAGGVFYGYPLFSEHTGTACKAVEQRFLTTTATGHPLGSSQAIALAVMRQYLEPMSSGAVAAAAAKEHYPNLPPELGCAAGYWASMLDPRVEKAIAGRMR